MNKMAASSPLSKINLVETWKITMVFEKLWPKARLSATLADSLKPQPCEKLARSYVKAGSVIS